MDTKQEIWQLLGLLAVRGEGTGSLGVLCVCVCVGVPLYSASELGLNCSNSSSNQGAFNFMCTVKLDATWLRGGVQRVRGKEGMRGRGWRGGGWWMDGGWRRLEGRLAA